MIQSLLIYGPISIHPSATWIILHWQIDWTTLYPKHEILIPKGNAQIEEKGDTKTKGFQSFLEYEGDLSAGGAELVTTGHGR